MRSPASDSSAEFAVYRPQNGTTVPGSPVAETRPARVRQNSTASSRRCWVQSDQIAETPGLEDRFVDCKLRVTLSFEDEGRARIRQLGVRRVSRQGRR